MSRHQSKIGLFLGTVVLVTAFLQTVNGHAQSVAWRTAPADLPIAHIITATDQIADGYIFVTTQSSLRDPGFALIYDNNGQPIYYKRASAWGLQVQPNGLLSWFNDEGREYILMDESYTVVNTVESVSYLTDSHDLTLSADGSRALLLRRINTDKDMTPWGGQADAKVINNFVQEIDLDNKLIFEWSSLDHLPVEDTIEPLTASLIDFVHANSVEYDYDGNILVSFRTMDEVTKIDRQTGEIIWRLGGGNGNQFTFLNDGGFFRQHDARRLPDGTLSLYDNRTDIDGLYSRAVRYRLNETAMTAEKVWEFIHPAGRYGAFMGNMQTLPNGNVMIGWGSNDVTNIMGTEVTPDGEIAFEFGLSNQASSYRVFRFEWEGRPTWPPELLPVHHDNEIFLYMSWNGSTEHTAYNVYHTPPNGTEQQIHTAPRTGFETTVQMTISNSGFHQYRVVPIDENGSEMMSSNNQTVLAGSQLHTLFLPVLVQN